MGSVRCAKLLSSLYASMAKLAGLMAEAGKQMSDNFENRYQDVLQNIEFAIVSVYREHAELADSNVDRSLEGLIRSYTAEATGKPAPTLRLNELDQLVFD